MFRNRTKMSLDLCIKSNKTAVNAVRYAMIGLMAVFIIIGAAIAAVNDIVIGVVIIIAGGGVCLLFAPLYPKELRKQLAKQVDAVGDDIINDYEFTETSFTVRTYKADDLKTTVTLEYTNIVKITESADILIIYISPAQFWVMDKNSMTEGSADDLVKMLIDVAGESKYKRVK